MQMSVRNTSFCHFRLNINEPSIIHIVANLRPRQHIISQIVAFQDNRVNLCGDTNSALDRASNGVVKIGGTDNFTSIDSAEVKRLNSDVVRPVRQISSKHLDTDMLHQH